MSPRYSVSGQQQASISFPSWRSRVVGLTLAGFGTITPTWRLRLLSHMVNLHLLIWRNTKIPSIYGTRNGRFFLACLRLTRHWTRVSGPCTRLTLCYRAYQPTHFKLFFPWALPTRSSTIIRSSSTISIARRNRHVWRKQFSAKKQCAQQSADDWLCELRDLARKCEFQTDSCARCEPTRILGQLIFGVESDEVRVKLLEQGDALTLDAALTILRTAEASNKQSINLKTGDAAAIQGANSTYRRFKQTSGRPPTL